MSIPNQRAGSDRNKSQHSDVYAFFSPKGLLSQNHPNFEFRGTQLEMAQAIETALSDRRHLLVEAGTGTGKTLAYLVPAILSGKRIVISTGTKNLQEQLFFKDVPFLQTLFGQPLAVCYMKGRSNYLCRQKVYDAETEPMLSGIEEAREFRIIREWEKTTESGDRSELEHLPERSSTWAKLDARSDLCAGQKCKQFDRCFVTEMHRRASRSDIIIVNHHLFFADLSVRDEPYGGILPDYQAVIFDEAHEIEDTAGQYFGMSVSNTQITDLGRDTNAIGRRKKFDSPDLDRALVHLNERNQQFFELFPQEGRQGFRDHEAFLERHSEIYRELLFSLDVLCNRLELERKAFEDVLPLVRRGRLLQQALQFWMEASDRTFVYWVERRGRGLYLQATPIDVAETLSARLTEHVESAIFTSATMTVAKSFEYTQTRLGLPNARTLLLDSQYDYSSQALFYVPSHLPDPRHASFTPLASTEIRRVLEASRGRAFVLFTSYGQMKQVYSELEALLDYPLLMQGSAPRNALINSFRNTPNAVLLATSSFWQGIDVQGEQLSCVIIDRLPFAVPSDPVVAARIESIQQSGGNPFFDYQIPQAALALKQGFGRLIRSSTDRGVLVLLDNRITKLQYGKTFFESLPDYCFTNRLKDVQNFFDV